MSDGLNFEQPDIRNELEANGLPIIAHPEEEVSSRAAVYSKDEIHQIRDGMSIAVAYSQSADPQIMDEIPWMPTHCLLELRNSARGELDLAIEEELQKRDSLENLSPEDQDFHKRKMARQELLVKVNNVAKFLADRLAGNKVAMGKTGQLLYGLANRQIQKITGATEEQIKNNIIFPNPAKTAEELTAKRKNAIEVLRNLAGSGLALLALRGANREFLLKMSKEDKDSRLSAWGEEIFKVVGLFFQNMSEKVKAPWRTQTNRLEATTAFFPIALNGRQELDTKDMAADEEGKLKATGLGVNAITVNFNLESPNEVRSTLIAQHQIDGGPTIELANRISEGEREIDAIQEIARTIYQTAQTLSNEQQVDKLLNGRRFQSIDYYQTRSAEYGMYTSVVKNDNISVCINGYEVILFMKNEQGELKSQAEIADDITRELRIAQRAVDLRNLYEAKLAQAGTKREQRKILRGIQKDGLMAAFLDMRPSTTSHELIQNARDVVTELKKQRLGEQTRFEKLSECLFRISINTHQESLENLQTEDIDQRIESARKAYKESVQRSRGKSEVLYQAEALYRERRGSKDLSASLLQKRDLLEKAEGERIETVDLTEQWNSLRSGVEKYLMSAASTNMGVDEQTLLTIAKQLRGDAKLLEVLRYATGGRPVNCVMAECADMGLQITNTFTGIEVANNGLMESYVRLLHKYDRERESVDQQDLIYARGQFIRALNTVSQTMSKARKGRTINGQLISLTEKAGELYVQQPKIVQRVIRRAFIMIGKQLPQFSSPETQELIAQLGKIDMRARKEVISAEIQMFLTNMIYPISGLYDDVAGNETLSVPKTRRTGAGVGATSATSRRSQMIMANTIQDNQGQRRTIFTFRGTKTKKAKREFLESLDIYSQIFAGRVTTAFSQRLIHPTT